MAKRDLTKEKIVNEALCLLDEEGLGGLSMRKLAARLHVQAPTLYHYIPDKSALLNEVLSVHFGRCIARMPQCDTWQEWMIAFGKAIWDLHQEMTYSPGLLLTTQRDEEHFQRTVALLRQELERFDADHEQLFFIQSAVQAVITGWSLFAISPASERMGLLFDFREAAERSVESIVRGWNDTDATP